MWDWPIHYGKSRRRLLLNGLSKEISLALIVAAIICHYVNLRVIRRNTLEFVAIIRDSETQIFEPLNCWLHKWLMGRDVYPRFCKHTRRMPICRRKTSTLLTPIANGKHLEELIRTPSPAILEICKYSILRIRVCQELYSLKSILETRIMQRISKSAKRAGSRFLGLVRSISEFRFNYQASKMERAELEFRDARVDSPDFWSR